MRFTTLFLVGLFISSPAWADEQLKLPPGFEAVEYAGPELSNNIFIMHIDAKSRVVVSGPGYVRELIDSDGDGKADVNRELIAGLQQGAMGLLWEGNVLYVVADGGLQRYTTVNGLSPSRERTTILKLNTGSEHGAHAVKRGPDGNLYVICGNEAGSKVKSELSPDGPMPEPIAGVVLKLNEADKWVDVLADGFRNAYDFDFNLLGDLFTFDSDNERCVGLPWYEPTRFYHVRPGAHHGWLNPQFAETFRLPPEYPDVAMPACTLGRGSPTAVTCYRHTHFPAHYQGGFFLADWTFGKIWFVPLIEENGQFVGKPELFLEANGDNGFAPTGMAVDPKTGELYISIGGRGTRGAVYRISYQENKGKGQPIAIVPRTEPLSKREVDPLIAKLRGMQLKYDGLVAPDQRSSVWAGYTLRQQPDAASIKEMLTFIHAKYPTTNPIQNRELTRMLAALEDDSPASLNTVAAHLDAESYPIDDVHHLIVIAKLRSKRTPAITRRVANALTMLDAKYAARDLFRDRNWPLRLSETVTLLLERDPNLAETLLNHPKFAESEQGWLANHPKIDARTAATRILEQATVSPDYQWTPELITRIGLLPTLEIKPLLDRIWNEGIFRDSIISILAKKPEFADRARYIEALTSLNPTIVKTAANALLKLKPEDDLLLPVIQSWRRFLKSDKTEATQSSLAKLLQKIAPEPTRTTQPQWEEWLKLKHPQLAKQLRGEASVESLRERIIAIDMTQGDPKRGELVYRKANCASCHDQTNAVGPDLKGVTKRFGSNDLMEAVINPNRDVPDRYQAVSIATFDGRVVEGIVIYQAVDGVILQTDAVTTIRVAGDNIETQHKLPKSLMPSSLLDPLSDREIADLFAYLHHLQKP